MNGILGSTAFTSVGQLRQDGRKMVGVSLVGLVMFIYLLASLYPSSPLSTRPRDTHSGSWLEWHHRDCLRVVMPTVPRIHARCPFTNTTMEIDYLRDTLQSYRDLARLLPYFCIDLTVVNLRPGKHEAWARARANFPEFRYVAVDPTYVQVPHVPPNLKEKLKEQFPGGEWKRLVQMSEKQRKQKRDFAAVMHTWAGLCDGGTGSMLSDVFVVVEDDMEWCPDAIIHLQRVLLKHSEERGNYTAIRFSYGLNGLLLQCRDVQPILNFILEKHHDYPVDWQLGVFWTKTDERGQRHYEDRPFFVYRSNIMRHIGLQTTVGSHKAPPTAYQCGQFEARMGLYPAEWYLPHGCEHSHFWPCTPDDAKEDRIRERAVLPRQSVPFKVFENGIKVLWTTENHKTCHEVCEVFSLQCSEDHFPMIGCEDAMKLSGCKSCGWDQTEAAPYVNYFQKCKDNDEGEMECELTGGCELVLLQPGDQTTRCHTEPTGNGPRLCPCRATQ